MRIVRNSSRMFSMIAVVVMLAVGGAGCKSKKKAMEAQAAAEKARMEQEAAAQRQREEEDRKRKEAEEQARREAQSRAQAPAQKLDTFFSAISNAATPAAANTSITEALTLFSSPETPVLIVISEENGQKDYDRPTTISKYLNYLKDQKKNPNKIGNLQLDSSGKITELELIKQY